MKTVLFDMDGTICETVPLCLASFKKALEPLLNREIPEKEITDTFGVSEEGTIRQLCPEKSEEGIRAYFENYKSLHDMCPAPFDGIVDLLGYLKSKGVFIGLITGKGHVSCDISLKYYGIKHYFDTIKTGLPTGVVKDQHMQEIMSENNFDDSDMVYIGDTVSDIKSSKNAGISIVSVAYSKLADEKELIKASPDKICYNVNELKGYLDEMI